MSSSNNFVSIKNHSDRTDPRLKINKKDKGSLIHLKSRKNYTDDILLLESSENKEMIKIDSEGKLFIQGKSISNNTSEEVKNEINLGSWKIVSDGDNLLIQKLVGNEWITKQHFN